MRRWLARIVICLVLGAMCTVAVAWGCAWFLPPGTTVKARNVRFAVVENSGANWLVSDAEGFGFRLTYAFGLADEIYDDSIYNLGSTSISDRYDGPRWVRFRNENALSDPQGIGFASWFLAHGWPRASFFSEQIGAFDAEQLIDTPDFKRRIIGGLKIRDDPKYGGVFAIVLPWRPVWRGFIIDTLFYGALWLGLFLGPSAARRGLRKKRGRCPMCGYDLRGDLDAGCPECGWNRENRSPESRLI